MSDFWCGHCGDPCEAVLRDYGNGIVIKKLHRSDCCDSYLFDEPPSPVNDWTAKDWREAENNDHD